MICPNQPLDCEHRAVRIDGGTFHVIDLPAGEDGAGDVPFSRLPSEVRMKAPLRVPTRTRTWVMRFPPQINTNHESAKNIKARKKQGSIVFDAASTFRGFLLSDFRDSHWNSLCIHRPGQRPPSGRACDCRPAGRRSLCGPSSTSSVISSPRWAGRQCITSRLRAPPHQRRVYLVRRETACGARSASVFLAHARPDIGIDDVGVGDRLDRVVGLFAVRRAHAC